MKNTFNKIILKNIFNKIFLISLCTAASLASFAQAPQKFNYQGIARDAKGNPLVNQQIQIKLSILPAADATIADYEETQLIRTNEFGLYALQVGNGTAVKGEMKNVQWETGNTYIKVAIDPAGGDNYMEIGTTQLLSVPYAMYANKAGSTVKSGNGTSNDPTIHVPGFDYWGEGGNILFGGEVFGSDAASPQPQVNFIQGGVNAGFLGNGGNVAFGQSTMAPTATTTSNGNTAVGVGALNSNSTGNENCAYGFKALVSPIASSRNSAFGYGAMAGSSSGDDNVAIGHLSQINATGSQNVSVGNGTLSNTVGGQNVATGEQSMPYNINGSANTASGYASLASNTDGNGNSAFGAKALDHNQNGMQNSAVGVKALDVNIDGNYNSALGAYADVMNPNQANSTAIGWDAKVGCDDAIVLGSLTGVGGAGTNVGIGTNCPTEKLEVIGKTKTNELQVVNGAFPGAILTSDGAGNATWQPCCALTGADWSLTGNTLSTNCANWFGSNTGSAFPNIYTKHNGTHAGLLSVGNFSQGVSALANGICGGTLTGTQNTATGTGALNSTNTGSQNTAHGYNAAASNQSGSKNTAVGFAALASNIQGGENVAVGSEAMSNATSIQDVAIGAKALPNSVAGSNVSIGFVSMQGTTSGDRNVAVGVATLNTNVTGSRNMALGTQADVAAPNLSNANAIGSGASVCASNATLIGAVGTNHKVGVGVCAPTSTVHVNGSFATAIRSAAVSTTLGDGDHTFICTHTAGILTVTLPNPNTCVGRIYIVKRNAAVAVVVATSAGVSIQNQTGFVFPVGATATNSTLNSVSYQSDGARWHRIDAN